MNRYSADAKKYCIQRIVGSQSGEISPQPTAHPISEAPENLPILLDEFSLRDRLARWFNHPWDSIEKREELHWRTLKYALTPAAIFEKWKRSDRLIGLGFGKTTNYLAIDIDSGSLYHSEEGLRQIKATLEDMGINETILIQSSYSGGWHIYAFLSELVPTFSLACGLHQVMETAGLTIGKGTLELFPNRKSFNKENFVVYNRLRLPLQPDSGSFLVDDDLLPYTDSIEVFLNLADRVAIANDLDILIDYCEVARETFCNTSKDYQSHFFKMRRLHKKIWEWKRKLEERIAKGLTARHQSNDLLGAIAEYGRVFMGLGGKALVDYITKTMIASPGYGRYCDHQKEIHQWAARWAKSAEKYRYPYGSKKDGKFKPLEKGGLTNEERKADAIARIVEAVEDLEASGRPWPKTLTEQRLLLSKMAHCSERTLAKSEYLPLWHPNHRNQSQDTANALNTGMVSLSDDDQQPDHTPAITEGDGSVDAFCDPFPEWESPNPETPANSYLFCSCTTPGLLLKSENARNLSGTTLQSISLEKPSEIVLFSRPMNQLAEDRQIKIGDRVFCSDYGYPLTVIDLHYGERSDEWLRAKADDWPSSELSHISELTLLEDQNYG